MRHRTDEVDRHKLWRRVSDEYEALKQVAPAGFEPSVLVFLVARAEPIEVGSVRTRNGADDPWVQLEALNRERPPGSADAHPKDCWVHVRENYIDRVELHFLPTGTNSTGFRHEVMDDDSGAGAG
jgi:hypothetical protein